MSKVKQIKPSELEHFSDALRNMNIAYNRLWPFSLNCSNTYCNATST